MSSEDYTVDEGRREFIKNASLTGLFLALSGLCGCSSSGSSNGITTKEYLGEDDARAIMIDAATGIGNDKSYIGRIDIFQDRPMGNAHTGESGTYDVVANMIIEEHKIEFAMNTLTGSDQPQHVGDLRATKFKEEDARSIVYDDNNAKNRLRGNFYNWMNGHLIELYE